jgi:ADP-dependent NAD(P)H-hydrate dehydratase / NAD(P)H-hydrate epimerase
VKALYNSLQIRHIEAYCLSKWPEGELIGRAAQALAKSAAEILSHMPEGAHVLALIGPGNNGQDAQLCSELMARSGVSTQSISLSQLESFADSESQFITWLETLNEQSLVIDGLFGIGLNRPLSPWLEKLFEKLNARPCKVIAVDIPSGLSCDSGKAQGTAIRADLTVTMLIDKVGLHTGEAAYYAGEVQVATLDCETLIDESASASAAQLLTQAWFAAQVPTRSPTAHKGTHGSVLVVGGAPGLRGAALLAALGAQAGGAGKVFLHFLDITPAEAFSLAMLHPSLMQFVGSDAWDVTLRGIDAVVLGCGLGQSEHARLLFVDILKACQALEKPLVLDADALNLMALGPRDLAAPLSELSTKARPWVLTPHPLEAARLLEVKTGQIQSDRITAARSLSEKFQAVTVLKGPGSIICAPAQPQPIAAQQQRNTFIAPSGSPALAVGGTGDVLAGLIGSLMAQGFNPLLAAQLGTSAHALAGSLWSETRPKSYGLKAEDLPTNIVTIMNSI